MKTISSFANIGSETLELLSNFVETSPVAGDVKPYCAYDCDWSCQGACQDSCKGYCVNTCYGNMESN